MSFWVRTVIESNGKSFAVVLNRDLKFELIGHIVEACPNLLDIASVIATVGVNDVISK